MKSILFFTLSLLAYVSSFAQDEASKTNKADKTKKQYPVSGYLAFGCGMAQPVGSFAETSQVNSNGFAKTGFMPGFLEFAIPIHRSNFGLAFNTNYCVNTINTGAMSQQSWYNWNYIMQTAQKRYNSVFLLGGLYITIPSQHFSFDVKALAGSAIVSMPNENARYSSGWNQSYIATNTITSHPSFACALGIDFRIYLSKHSCAYIGTSFEHTNSKHTLAENEYSPGSQYDFNLPVSIGTLTVGYAVRF